MDILRHTQDKVARYEATIEAYKKKLGRLSSWTNGKFVKREWGCFLVNHVITNWFSCLIMGLHVWSMAFDDDFRTKYGYEIDGMIKIFVFYSINQIFYVMFIINVII